MSADKYPSIFSPQMKAIVYISLIFVVRCTVEVVNPMTLELPSIDLQNRLALDGVKSIKFHS